MSEIKFTYEELQSLSELSQTYRDLQTMIGQVAVQKILNKQQADRIEESEIDLNAKYVDNQQKERDLVKSLNEKYGPGQLDPQTGVFTPAPKEESQQISDKEEKTS